MPSLLSANMRGCVFGQLFTEDLFGQGCSPNQMYRQRREISLTPLVKVHLADFDVFKKLRVKAKLLEGLDPGAEVSQLERATQLDREQWNRMLDSDPDALVLDIRCGIT